MDTYKIIRFFRSGRKSVIYTGLTLDEAQKHCSLESTHKINKKTGEVIWFDGYTRE